MVGTSTIELEMGKEKAKTGYYFNYFSIEDTVQEGKQKRFDMLNEIGRYADSGYIKADNGDILIQINDGSDIKIKNGETFTLNPESKLLVETITIKTESQTAVTYRAFLT